MIEDFAKRFEELLDEAREAGYDCLYALGDDEKGLVGYSGETHQLLALINALDEEIDE